MLPFSLGACIISFFTGFLINAIGDVRQIMWASYVRNPHELSTKDNAHRHTDNDDPWFWPDDNAYGGILDVKVIFRPLLYHAHDFYSATQVIFPLLAGLGLGGLFYPPIIAMQAAMPLKDMATSTAAVGLLRQLGCTVGVAIGQAIWSSVSGCSSSGATIFLSNP